MPYYDPDGRWWHPSGSFIATESDREGIVADIGEDLSLSRQREQLVQRYGVLPSDADHGTLLRMIEDYLKEGLQTKVDPFPETDREFSAILDELRERDPDDLRAKLVISGWLLHPHGAEEMRCQECMYYLVHRRWCDLPELSLPAEPEWWCRLWRI